MTLSEVPNPIEIIERRSTSFAQPVSVFGVEEKHGIEDVLNEVARRFADFVDGLRFSPGTVPFAGSEGSLTDEALLTYTYGGTLSIGARQSWFENLPSSGYGLWLERKIMGVGMLAAAENPLNLGAIHIGAGAAPSTYNFLSANTFGANSIELSLAKQGLHRQHFDIKNYKSADTNAAPERTARFAADGNVTFHRYPSSRNDTGSTVPANFLYTNNSGTILSAPLTSISPYDFENGLTEGAGIVELGGQLVRDTLIEGGVDGNSMRFRNHAFFEAIAANIVMQGASYVDIASANSFVASSMGNMLLSSYSGNIALEAPAGKVYVSQGYFVMSEVPVATGNDPSGYQGAITYDDATGDIQIKTSTGWRRVSTSAIP